MHGLRGYEPLPEWVEDGKEPDPALRDEGMKANFGEVATTPGTAGGQLDRALKEHGTKRPAISGANGKAVGSLKDKSLDDWLAEEGSEEESSEEEESGEEESGEEEETDESEEGSEEEESEEDGEEDEDDEGEDKNETGRLMK